MKEIKPHPSAYREGKSPRDRVYSKASTQSVRQGDSPEKEGGGPPVLPVP